MMDAFVEAVSRHTDTQTGSAMLVTRVQGLTLLRSDHAKRPHHLVFKPALCIVVQGAKWAIFGETRIDYRAGQALVVSIEMPAYGTVAEASPTKPYLGVIIEFDLAVMREVMESLHAPPRGGGEAGRGVFVTDFDGPLADCALRMVRLLDAPEAIPLLYPGVMREICYWLLTGPHGAEVMSMTISKSHTRSVIHAIHCLQDRFAEPLRIQELASIAHMSPSAFHRRFKAITSMTPLQYQKQLRLIEARRVMIADEANVETAAFQVGYESPSQFSREYLRMFGISPRRDVSSLKGVAA